MINQSLSTNPEPLSDGSQSAWLAIAGLALVSLVCLAAGASSILKFLFPAGAAVVAIYLYQCFPVMYLGFSWWIWFLSPWVARLADYYGSWDPQRTILITPYLVSMICGLSVVQYLPKAHKHGGLPFQLALTAVSYGFILGLAQYPVFDVFRALLDWLTPILMGFYLFRKWQHYPEYKKNFKTVFVWALIILGSYGIYQYLVAPAWDQAWLRNIKETSGINSFGTPEPRGIRVFSLMQSPGPFASVMMTGLLVLFSYQGPLLPLGAGLGFLCFILTQVRSAWVGWILGLIIHSFSLKSSLQIRLFTNVFGLGILMIPLVSIEPFSSMFFSRFNSLFSLSEDHSYVVRRSIYQEGLTDSLLQFIGKGIGSVTAGDVIDSGVLEMLNTLGWMGTLSYLLGLFLILFILFSSKTRLSDVFVSVCQAIFISSLAQMVINSSVLSISGVLTWSVAGLGMAGCKYHFWASRQPLESKPFPERVNTHI